MSLSGFTSMFFKCTGNLITCHVTEVGGIQLYRLSSSSSSSLSDVYSQSDCWTPHGQISFANLGCHGIVMLCLECFLKWIKSIDLESVKLSILDCKGRPVKGGFPFFFITWLALLKWSDSVFFSYLKWSPKDNWK